MASIGIVLDPSEVATGRTELNLHSGAYQIADDGPDWGDAEVAASLAERRFGSVPVGYRLPNRIVTIPLILRASGGTTFNAAQMALQQKVARLQDEGGWLKRTSRNGTTKLYADVVNASLTFPEPRYSTEIAPDVVLTLECLPDFYGDEAAGVGSTASSGDHDSVVFTEAAVPGDYPARSRYTFTDTGSQARNAVVVASQSRTYSAAATAALAYEAEALTPLDTAAVVTQSGAHGGASNNAVKHSQIGPYWTPILSTQHASLGHLTHTGNYRVYARVWSDNAASLRLEYAIGDAASRRTNDTATVYAGGAFFIVDLGEVRIPSDATRWIGAIFCQSSTHGTSTGVDKIYFAPAESISIVKSRREVTADVGIGLTGYTGRDYFLQTSGALSGKTAQVGGNWTTAGAAGDFAVDSANANVERTAVSDASAKAGRFAVLGSAVTDAGVSVEFACTNDVPTGFQAALIRYVDTNNWMAGGLYRDGFGNGFHYLIRVVGGSQSDMYAGASMGIDAGVGYSAGLKAAADGSWQFFFNGVMIASGQHSVLATGGALASGKCGFYDAQTSATANSRKYDRYLSWTPDPDPACLSGKELSIRYDGAKRETTTAGVYAPTHVEGAYPRAPVAGVEARTCRTLVLPTTSDFDTLPDADPLAFSVRSYHRPAYLFAPKE